MESRGGGYPGNFLRRHFHLDHACRGIHPGDLPARLYGAPLSRVRDRGGRRRTHFSLRIAHAHPGAQRETHPPRPARPRLVLPVHRTDFSRYGPRVRANAAVVYAVPLGQPGDLAGLFRRHLAFQPNPENRAGALRRPQRNPGYRYSARRHRFRCHGKYHLPPDGQRYGFGARIQNDFRGHGARTGRSGRFERRFHQPGLSGTGIPRTQPAGNLRPAPAHDPADH